MGDFSVWVPYFFEEECVTVTVTSNRYLEILERFFHPKVVQLLAVYNPDDVRFQIEGATSNTSRRSLVFPPDLFPYPLVSLRGKIG